MANKQLNVLLTVKDQYSKEMKSFSNALKTNKSELKLVDEQLKVNSKDSEALATKQKLLAKETEVLSNQQKATANMLRVSTTELEKQASKCNTLEKELKDLENQYKKNAKELGSESKLTQTSLKAYEKKRKELSSANKQYGTLEKSVTSLNVKMNNLSTSHIKASNEFARTTLEIQNMDKAADKADKSLDKLTKKDYTKIADGMMKAGAALGTALVGMGTLGANESMQFEYGQAKIGSIVDVSQEDLSNLGDTVIETSNKFGIASKDIQDSIYQALSSSVKFEDVQKVLEESIKLSKGGFALLTPTLDVLTNIMNSYGKSASEVQSISDALFKTTVVGKTTIEQLATQFSGLSVIAANTEVSLEQALSGLALLTQSGTSTSEAVTQIRALLNELGNDTTTVGKAIKDNLGMSFQDAMKSGAKLDDILLGLDKSAKSSGSNLSNMLGSIEAKQASMQIMADNGKKFDTILQQIADSAGVTQEAFDKVDSTKMADMEKSIEKVKNSMLSVGEAVSPYIDVVSDGIEKIADVIKETDADTVNLLTTISAVTIGLGGTLKMTSAIGSALATIKPIIAAVGLGLGQIALIGGGIAAVVGIFDTLNTTLDEQNKKLEKAETNLVNVKSEYDKLANNPNRTEAQEAILRGLEKEIELNEKILAQEREKTIRNEAFGDGRFGSGSLGSASGLQADIEYTKQRIKELEEYAKTISDQATKDAIDIEMGKQYQKLGKYSEEFRGHLENVNNSIDVATDKEKKQIATLNDFGKALDDVTTKVNDNTSVINESTNSQQREKEAIEYSSNALDNQKSSIKKLNSTYDTAMSITNEFDSITRKLADGQYLTKQEVDNLVEKYPDLQDEISKTSDGYTIQESALGKVRDASIDTSINMIDSQIDATTATITETQNRLNAYQAEIIALSELASLQNIINGTGRTVHGIEDISSQDLEGLSGIERQTLLNTVQGKNDPAIDAFKQVIAESQDALKALEQQKETLLDRKYTNKGDSKSSSSSSSKGGSKSGGGSKKDNLSKQIKDELDKAIKEIQSARNKLDSEIEMLNSKLTLAKTRGDNTEIERLLNQMSPLLSKRKQLTAEENVQLELLKKKYNQEESIATIESEMSKNSLDWWSDENNIIEHNIALLQKRIEIMTKPLEKIEQSIDGMTTKLELLQLTQEDNISVQIKMMYDLNEEYLKQQQCLEDVLEDLYSQRDSVSETSSMYEELTNKIMEFEKQQANAIKSEIDLRKEAIDLLSEEMSLQLENAIYGKQGKESWEDDNDDRIDSLNKELDIIKQQSDAKKKAEEAEKRALEMQQLREKLANLQKQKVDREYKKQSDGSYQWEYVADKEAIAQVEKEIKDRELEDERRLEEEKQYLREQSIRDEIARCQKEKEIKAQAFELAKNDLITHLTTTKDLWNVNGQEVVGIVDGSLLTVSEKFDVTMSDIIRNVEGKLDEMAGIFDGFLGLIGSMGGSGGSSGGSVYSGTGGSGKVYFQYPDGSIEVQRKDGSSSTVYPTSPNYGSTVNAMEKDKVVKKYSKGGLIDYDGIAMVHGGKDPEMVLNPTQTRAMMLMAENMPRFSQIMDTVMRPNVSKVEPFRTPAMTTNSFSKYVHIENMNLPNVQKPEDFSANFDRELGKYIGGVSQKAKLKPTVV